MTKVKKRNWKKIIGIILIVEAFLTLTPPFFISPIDLDFYFLFLIPILGVRVLAVPFLIAVVMFVVGMWLLNLPMNGNGVKRAIKKVKIKRRKKVGKKKK